MNDENFSKIEQEIQDAEAELDRRSSMIQGEADDLDRKINRYTNWAWVFVWGGVGILVIGAICYLTDSDEMLNLNLLGDFYGGTIASVWALAGLFLIYVAFLGQKKQLLYQQLEIKQSQMEVKYTRLELEGQKKEMMQQNETLRQQRFENTFFQLLTNYNNLVNSMDITYSSSTVTGKDCFPKLYAILKDNLKRRLGGEEINNPWVSVDTNKATLDDILDAYRRLVKTYQSDLGPYFSNIINCLDFIASSDMINKEFYMRLFQAQLSNYELVLIFYYGLSESRRGKDFKSFIEKYTFLEYINKALIINEAHMNKYAPTAYVASPPPPTSPTP